MAEPRAHRATLESLNWSHRELGELEEAIDELHGTRVALTVNTRNGRRRRSGVVLADADRPEDATGQGEIEWKFSDTFRAVVANSRHWAAISARAVLAMDCKYAPWLYQLCALHAGRDKISEDWDLADLRERLGASAPSFKRWISFRDRVLDPACAEINQLTGIGVAWEPIKYGRKVMGVRLSTWRKGAAEIAEADAELARHRAGRKERRSELVERIVEEREAWSRETEAKLADLTARRAEAEAVPAADPRQTDLEEAIAVAGVRLTAAQLMLGAEAARAEGAAAVRRPGRLRRLAAGGRPAQGPAPQPGGALDRLLQAPCATGEGGRGMSGDKLREAEHPWPRGAEFARLSGDPFGGGMRVVLEFHRDTFETWRYSYEATSAFTWPPQLDEVLTAIIETYNPPTPRHLFVLGNKARHGRIEARSQHQREKENEMFSEIT